MSGTEEKTIDKVVVHPAAFCGISTHAVAYPNDEIHGVLLGKLSGKVSTVYDAVPVAHGPPTRNLVEIALGLIPSLSEYDIVGWYTAPMLLEDTRPSPVALRIVSSLKTASIEPIMVVVNNIAMAKCVKGEATNCSGVLTAMGRDFADQYLDKIHTSIEKSAETVKAASTCRHIKLVDLSEHLDQPDFTNWYPNTDVQKAAKSL